MCLGSLARQPSLDRASAAAVLLLLVFLPIAVLAPAAAHRQVRRYSWESGIEGGGAPGGAPGWSEALSAVAFIPLLSVRLPKRGRGQIISTILAAASEGESSKTRLMYKSNLDSRELKRYIALLTNNGLLLLRRDTRNRESYYLTDKGRDFLQRYNELEKFLTRL